MTCLAPWPAAAEPPFFAGNWFGFDQPVVKSVMWVVHWEPGGAFRAEFRHCNRGRAQDVRAVGHWTSQQNRVTVYTTAVDGKAFAVTDIYEMLIHDRERLTYRDAQSGFVYRASRVAGDFDMPSCEMVG
jgi:hypothetical protein